MLGEKKSHFKIGGYLSSLILLSSFAVGLSMYRMIVTGSERYWFLLWNLALAWLPVAFARLLYKQTSKGISWSWQNFTLFTLWLLFLPNAFYLVSDFIHIHDSGEIGLMYDVVLIGTYAWCGFVLGYTALFMVHIRALQRFGRQAHWLVVGSLLLSGFAIYLGRFLRWNSWDIIANPSGLLFDVSETIINPQQHVLSFSTTILFFAFLSVIYFVVWRAAAAIAASTKK